MANKPVALLDRNVVSKLEGLQKKMAQGQQDAMPTWFIQGLGLDSEMLNPLLYVLEGERQRPPTSAELRRELNRARNALTRALPSAKVIPVNKQLRTAIEGIAKDIQLNLKEEIDFLTKAVPLVRHAASPSKRLTLETDILNLAKQCGVSSKSLVVLAVISCIYDEKSPTGILPGRRLLKPKAVYSARAAYNAVMDIRFLTLLISGQASFKSDDLVLYTGDLGLAAFWSALGIRSLSWEPSKEPGRGYPGLTLSITEHLMPALDEQERAALADRLSSFK